MCRWSIAAVAAVSTVTLVQIAAAADLPRKAPPAPPPQPVFSWTGFYAGVNAGGGWRDPADFTTVLTPCNIAGNCTSSVVFGNPANQALGSALGTGSGSKDSGFVGGGQIGYNWQFNNIVLGIEGDVEYFKRSSSLTGSGIVSTGDVLTVSNEIKSNWLATVRPRLGYAWDRLLVYATGGVAFTKREYTQTMVTSLGSASGTQTVSETKAGWTVGGGVEYAIWNNWSIRAEYLYLQFAGLSGTGAIRSGTNSNVFTGSTGNVRDNIVRAGLNYRFGGR